MARRPCVCWSVVAERRRGLVVALQANFCRVVLDAVGPHGVDRLLCTRRTRLGKSGLQICVGDRVEIDGIDWPAARGAVVRLEPRQTLLARPAVANVSRVVVVVSLVEPLVDPLQLCRFLVTAEATGVPVELVLTKADLTPPDSLRHWQARLECWGYAPLAVSSHSGAGLERLRARLARPGIAVVCGPSGVGKSSLINALLPDLALRVGSVSGRLQRGRHTTRHVELFPLLVASHQPVTALLADSPGFNRPELPLDPQALAALFPELRQRLALQSCRFSNCRHQGDPGCAMGTDWDRYSLYGQCLKEVEQASLQAQRRSRNPVDGLRLRAGGLEPRLAPGLRRPSRRRSRQQLEADGPGDGLSPPGRED